MPQTYHTILGAILLLLAPYAIHAASPPKAYSITIKPHNSIAKTLIGKDYYVPGTVYIAEQISGPNIDGTSALTTDQMILIEAATGDAQTRINASKDTWIAIQHNSENFTATIDNKPHTVQVNKFSALAKQTSHTDTFQNKKALEARCMFKKSELKCIKLLRHKLRNTSSSQVTLDDQQASILSHYIGTIADVLEKAPTSENRYIFVESLYYYARKHRLRRTHDIYATIKNLENDNLGIVKISDAFKAYMSKLVNKILKKKNKVSLNSIKQIELDADAAVYYALLAEKMIRKSNNIEKPAGFDITDLALYFDNLDFLDPLSTVPCSVHYRKQDIYLNPKDRWLWKLWPAHTYSVIEISQDDNAKKASIVRYEGRSDQQDYRIAMQWDRIRYTVVIVFLALLSYKLWCYHKLIHALEEREKHLRTMQNDVVAKQAQRIHELEKQMARPDNDKIAQLQQQLAQLRTQYDQLQTDSSSTISEQAQRIEALAKQQAASKRPSGADNRLAQQHHALQVQHQQLQAQYQQQLAQLRRQYTQLQSDSSSTISEQAQRIEALAKQQAASKHPSGADNRLAQQHHALQVQHQQLQAQYQQQLSELRRQYAQLQSDSSSTISEQAQRIEALAKQQAASKRPSGADNRLAQQHQQLQAKYQQQLSELQTQYTQLQSDSSSTISEQAQRIEALTQQMARPDNDKIAQLQQQLSELQTQYTQLQSDSSSTISEQAHRIEELAQQAAAPDTDKIAQFQTQYDRLQTRHSTTMGYLIALLILFVASIGVALVLMRRIRQQRT